jgi:hypothetical protein
VDLAPEFPVLDGDSGKTAGVAVFFVSLRSKPLMRIANFRFVSACSGGLSIPIFYRCAPTRSKIIAPAEFFCT